MDTLILIVILAAIVALFFWKPQKGQQPKQVETAQDLLNYEEITPDGLVVLPGRQFCAIIAVQAINMLNKSFDEQAAVWNVFRQMLNSINIPIDMVVQSRRLDLKEYIFQLDQQKTNIPNSKLQAYGKKLVHHLEEWAEETSVKNRKYFIYLKMDTQALSSIDSGISLENETLQRLVDGFKSIKGESAAKLSKEEAVQLARGELDNTSQVIMGYLDSMGCRCQRLERAEVIELLYSSLNRDLAPVALFSDANRAYSFAPYTQSLTPASLSAEFRTEAAAGGEQ